MSEKITIEVTKEAAAIFVGFINMLCHAIKGVILWGFIIVFGSVALTIAMAMSQVITHFVIRSLLN